MERHYPVMLSEVLTFVKQYCSLHEVDHNSLIIFDGTLGHAGHLIALMKEIGHLIRWYIATDVDKQMISQAQEAINQSLSADLQSKIIIKHGSYDQALSIAQELGIEYDVFFLDLGVNLWHFKLSERGFSIKGEGCLDMRYDQDSDVPTGAYILNTYSTNQLIDMFVINSEISYPTSNRLAQEIVHRRSERLWEHSTQLNDLTKELGYSAKVAAIVFQAIRIQVNSEFNRIRSALGSVPSAMKTDGIMMILSYHSSEDRIVKQCGKELEIRGIIDRLTKHALPPTYRETQYNKPSRSAKLRVRQCKQKPL
ncbi:MAG TPA: 16S rRNA (cytosine(1402)-N(4))-methyltransferase RsmH [Candidatus Absconditabacterales bacterium]|nr:16S rRNA (cytosine(1402)-N(4))-methyltransferase RsmH [Candidatus Absconditabacterales bacterium]